MVSEIYFGHYGLPEIGLLQGEYLKPALVGKKMVWELVTGECGGCPAFLPIT